MTQPSAPLHMVGPVHAVLATTVVAPAAGVLVLVYLAIVVVSFVAAVRVVTKAGYSGWWVLITLVPVVNFVMVLVFAFSDWPVLREIRVLRAQAPSWPAGPGAGFGGGPGPWMTGGAGGAFPPPGPPFGGAPAPDADRLAAGEGGGGHLEAEAPLPPFHPAAEAPSPEEAPSPQAAAEPIEAPVGAQAAPAEPPPGWYRVPDGRLRYWDGTAWTDHFA